MRKLALVLVVLLALAAAGSAVAQSVVSESEREQMRGIPDKWGITLGSFWQAFDSKFRLNGTTQTGDDIDLETQLRLPKNSTNFELTGFWRISDHSRLDVLFLGWSRKKTTTIDQEIHWGDVVYDVGAKITAQSDGRLFNVIYKYSFFNNGNVTFGLNGGLSNVWTTNKLSGEGTISGGGTASGEVSESKSTLVPIPVLGLHFDMLVTKRLLWKAEGNFFAATIAGYNGHLNELTTSLSYYFTPNIGLGAGWASTYIKVKKTGDNGGDFYAKVGFSGATAYVALAF
jgi:hypothetical protein